MKGFILHGKAAEMIFLRFAPKNRPARPAKPVDTMKNEGLTALHCILLYVYGPFRQSELSLMDAGAAFHAIYCLLAR